MSKPLTMTVERWDALCKAVTKSRSADLLDTFKELAAVRAALAAAEAALADDRRHADALKEGLAACVGERATFYAGQTQTVTWAVAIEHAERLLSEHRARRAHDSECESEFDSQVHAQTPCGCAARRAAEVSRDRP